MNPPCSLLWRELRQNMNFSVLVCSSLTIASPSTLLEFKQRTASSHELGISILMLYREKTNSARIWLMKSLNRVWKQSGLGGVLLDCSCPPACRTGCGTGMATGWEGRLSSFSRQSLLLQETSALKKPLHLTRISEYQ